MENLNLFFRTRFGNLPRFNFDLGILTNNFSFYDFCNNCINSKFEGEYGAFLVISDRQCVLGYNQGFGSGCHCEAFARFYADAYLDGRDIYSQDEILPLSSFVTDHFITARIVYEKTCNNLNSHIISHSGYINFNLLNNRFSLNELELFKKFYDKFNEELKLLNQKYGLKMYVYYIKDNNPCSKEINDLDFILDIISNNIYYEEIDSNEKVVNYSLFNISSDKLILK